MQQEPRDLSRFSNRDFQRGASSCTEALWVAVKCLVFTTGWPLPSRFKNFLLRLFGAKVGRGVVIRSRVDITFPWKLQIGDHVWIGEGVRILNLAPVEIGSHVCISQEAFLCTGSHDMRKASFDLIAKPIRVKDGAWIAARAFVAPGVTIGAQAVVFAGAILSADVADHFLVRGNPALPVRNLSES